MNESTPLRGAIEINLSDVSRVLSKLGFIKRDLELTSDPIAAICAEDAGSVMEMILAAAEAGGADYLRDTYSFYLGE